MGKVHHRYRLILDENMPKRQQFPLLNERHNLKHTTHEYKQIGISDAAVYELAKKNKSLLITFNVKHFKEQASLSSLTGIIGVSKNLNNEQIDLKIMALLRKKKPGELYGHLRHISGETL